MFRQKNTNLMSDFFKLSIISREIVIEFKLDYQSILKNGFGFVLSIINF